MPKGPQWQCWVNIVFVYKGGSAATGTGNRKKKKEKPEIENLGLGPPGSASKVLIVGVKNASGDVEPCRSPTENEMRPSLTSRMQAKIKAFPAQDQASTLRI